MTHIPVLLQEAIELLDLRTGDTVLDCTINNGGHSSRIVEKIGKRGHLIGLDADSNALLRARDRLAGSESALDLEEANFRELDSVLDRLGVSEIDKVLFDLGISSDQLETSGRGFSFNRDEPLLMTMSVIPKLGQLTALELVNSWDEDELARIIREYGEERYAGRIAAAIARTRKRDVIRTSGEFADVIRSAVPARYASGRIHPATRTFQAIRIAVNDELEALREGLAKAAKTLVPGGRIAVITFHSLEDRIVKQYFRSLAESNFKILTKKPITPTEEEIKANPRARSAKLRGIEKSK